MLSISCHLSLVLLWVNSATSASLQTFGLIQSEDDVMVEACITHPRHFMSFEALNFFLDAKVLGQESIVEHSKQYFFPPTYLVPLKTKK